MQQVVFDEPYEFIPPFYSDWGPHILRYYVRHYIRKAYGVHSVECRHVERLKASVEAGNSIDARAEPLPAVRSDGDRRDGARSADCICTRWRAGTCSRQSAFQTFMIRASARSACCAKGTTASRSTRRSTSSSHGKRPLIVFPEGALTQHNDIINEMMDGPTFLARQAAKRLRRRRQLGEVVIHPVAIRYFFDGDLAQRSVRRSKSSKPGFPGSRSTICRCSSGSPSWATRFSRSRKSSISARRSRQFVRPGRPVHRYGAQARRGRLAAEGPIGRRRWPG